MNGSSFLHRLTTLLVVGAVFAGVTASVAAAGVNRPPDVSDAATALYSTPQGLTADGLRLQGIAQVYKQIAVSTAPDAFERYATAHPYGTGVSVPTTTTLVSRPPDVRDAAEAARFVSVGQPSSGFDWNDWAIGIGSGMGIALLLAGGLAAGLQRRHRMQTA